MQQNPSTPNVQKEKKDHARWDDILRKLRAILLENWGTKLLALVIAIALWAGLITQDPTLTREKQFTDVSVSVNGAETLKRNGFIVLEDIDSLYEDFTLRVDVPQNQYAAAQASNYSLRIDLTRIREAGEQAVNVLYTNSPTYGKVSEIVPPQVFLTVDEYVTRYRVPVTVSTQGTVPEGFYATKPTTDPPVVAISGPKTIVEKVAAVKVAADQSSLPAQEGSVRRSLKFEMVDAAGEPVESKLLQVTSESVLLDSVVVEQKVYAQRVVEFSDVGLVTGTPAAGYEVKGVYISPSTATIAGTKAAIQDLDLLYANNTVDITDRTESINKVLWVRTPTTVEYVSTDVITVAVEIGPIMTGRAYVAPIRLLDMPAYLMETSGVQSATVYISGAQNWLDSISSSAVTVYCDMSGITEPGEYEVPLNCVVSGGEGQNYTCDIMPRTVSLTIERH